MSNSVLVTGILLILLAGIIAVVLAKLLLKKSIFFKIVAVITLPILNAVIVGFIVGSLGLKHVTWAAPWAVLLILVGYAVAAGIIQRPLNEILRIVELLAKGDLNLSFDKKFLKGGTETARTMRGISGLAESLKNIALFADHVGKGELNSEYTLLSENDSLGKAMLEMRQSLKNAEKEQSILAREEEHRNWATQGLAKFAEILRKDNENLETLSYNVISNMVKYLDANQGGIFVLNDAEHEDEQLLEMKACYAFDRRKFAEKQIHPGEGLVGACYVEGETIYLTEVPNQYISIGSGLGDANPRAILISPLKVNDVIYGVIELASFREFEPYQLEFVQKVSESIASTISTVKVNIRTNRLLEQTKLQAEEMANQEEELRQNMEEMQATQEEMRRREFELQETMAKMRKVQEIAEEKDHGMQQFYRMIYDSNNVVEFSSEGVITDVNPNILHMFNSKDKNEFIGKRMAAFIGEEAYKMAWANLTSGEYYEDVQNVTTAPGITKLVRQKCMPICDKQGKLTKVLLLAFHEYNEL